MLKAFNIAYGFLIPDWKALFLWQFLNNDIPVFHIILETSSYISAAFHI